jgi:dethiobiotin synthetase
MRGVFVTGTDTGCGKSIVAAAACAAMTANGQRVAAFKPAVTGLADAAPAPWPHDHELLARAGGGHQAAEEVAPYRFDPPLSPHYAAALAGATIDPAQLLARARAAGQAADALVCEGVGGLMVPLTTGYLVRDLAIDLELPVVVAARPGLGTINHTLLTLEAARAAGLRVAGVVMTPWPAAAEGIESSNRATIALIGAVEVSALPATDPDRLAAAGAMLPIADWLGPSSG